MTMETMIGRGIAIGMLVTAGVVVGPGTVAAQDPTSPQMTRALESGAHLGPVIESSGFVFTLEAPDFALPADQQFKVVFGVSSVPDDPTFLNPQLDRVARFINMHAEAGVPRENLDLVVVLFGHGSGAGIGNSAYRERFGIDNPNAGLLHALSDLGVEIYVCAQSARLYDFPLKEFDAPVKLALSAMTVFAALDHKGYYVDSR